MIRWREVDVFTQKYQKGEATENVSGLAIVEDLSYLGAGSATVVIVHIPSGLVLLGPYNRQSARMVLLAIGRLVDWTMAEDDLRRVLREKGWTRNSLEADARAWIGAGRARQVPATDERVKG
jgi:hypothetical protein